MIGGVFRWLRAQGWPLGLAVLLHVAVGVLLVLGQGVISAEPLTAPGRGAQHEPIQAVVVSESDFKAAQAQIEQAHEARQARVQKLKKQAAAAREAREQAQQKLAQLRERKQQKRRTAQHISDEVAARRKKLARLKHQAQAAIEKREAAQAAAEKAQARAHKARQARKAQKARIAKAKAQAEARAQAKAKARRTAQMQAAVEAAAARHRKRVRGNWIAAIRATVTGNWNRPLSAPDDLDCRVQITQLPSGQVIGVNILECNGGPAVKQTIKTAIYKSSPLPTPADPDVFQRQITFVFNPRDNS